VEPSKRLTLKDRRVWHPLFTALELPPRFEDAAPLAIANESIRVAVELYIKDFWEMAERGIAPVFLGRAGQYKTFGAACIARYVRYQQLPVRFVECGRFFMDLDSKFYQANGMQAYEEAATVPFLILDDFTQVKAGTRSAELLANLLSERFSATLPTLVTGNIRGRDRKHGLELISEHYRPDFARRLLHGSGATYDKAGPFYVTV
jgi:hypothetical protein